MRSAELALVARHLVGRAAASPLARPEEATGARIHGGNQLKPGGKLRPLRRAGDGDVAGFEGLAQCLQRGTGEFGQLVQKQHTLVGERDFARAGRRAAC